MNQNDVDFIEAETPRPYEETVLAADTGTVTFRDYGNGDVWLGVREGNEPESPPRVFVKLTHRQQRVLCGLFIDCRKFML